MNVSHFGWLTGRTFLCTLVGGFAIFLAAHVASATPLLTIDWQRQIGTASTDIAHDIAVDDSGNSYIAGETAGNLNGETNNGMRDAFQFSLDASGADQWTQLSGTTEDDIGLGNAAEPSGVNYLAGWTREDLSGTYHGENDIFAHGFIANGGAFSGHQWGTSSFDSGHGIGIDSASNRYIVGQTSGDLNGETGNSTSQAFLLKQNDTGVLQWTRLLGTTASELGADVAVAPGGTAVITGFTGGNLAATALGFNDVFVAQYDTNGNQQWVEQLGTTGSDNAYGVGMDAAGNVYITGEIGGSIDSQAYNGGFADAFVAKYDSSGNFLWGRIVGDTGDDSAQAIAVDASGNSYIVGWTNGEIGGLNPFSQRQTFLAKYDTAGDLKWTHQLDTPFRMEGNGIALWNNHIYIAGSTYGPLVPGQWQGGIDNFVIRFTQIPEPSAWVLAMIGLAPLSAFRRRVN